MKTPTLFILTKTPYITSDLSRVIKISTDMKRRDEEVGILLTQDAVLSVIRGPSNRFAELLARALEMGVKIYVLEPDAVARGLRKDRTVHGIEFIDYGQWVDIVVNKYQRIASWT